MSLATYSVISLGMLSYGGVYAIQFDFLVLALSDFVIDGDYFIAGLSYSLDEASISPFPKSLMTIRSRK